MNIEYIKLYEAWKTSIRVTKIQVIRMMARIDGWSLYI